MLELTPTPASDRPAYRARAVVVFFTCVSSLTACSEGRSTQASQTGRDTPDASIHPEAHRSLATAADSAWRPLEAAESYADRSLSDWAAEWVRWDYSQTSCEDPMFDDDGSKCALYNDAGAPVFFLSTGEPGTSRPNCSVPAGRAILLPLAVIAWDNAGVPVDVQLTEAELEQEVKDIVATLIGTHLRVDGFEVEDLAAYRVEPRRLSYTVPPEPNWFSCNGLPDVTGEVGPAFVGGAFVLLPPPPPGSHQLEFGGALYVSGLKSVNEVSIELHVE